MTAVPHLHPKDRPASRQVGRGDEIERRLLIDWSYTYRLSGLTEGATYRIQVPAGVTYRPSVPDVASVFVPERNVWVASLPHDVLYQVQGDVTRLRGLHLERWRGVRPSGPHEPIQSPWTPVPQVSRRHADRLFRHVTLAVGTARWRAQAAYLGVRSPFGYLAWIEKDRVPTVRVPTVRVPTVDVGSK